MAGAACSTSGQDLVQNASGVHRRTLIAAIVPVSELEVVHAQQVEDGGVEVVDVEPVLDGPQPERVCGAYDLARFHAAAGQEHGEAVGIVVPADALLGHRGPAELPAPDD